MNIYARFIEEDSRWLFSVTDQSGVRLTKAQHSELLAGEVNGQRIGIDAAGLPILEYVATPTVVPNQCTPAQGLVALYALKQIKEEDVFDAIARIPEPLQQYTARIGYQRATTWERGSPTMQAMAQLLQLSEADLDELFTYAVTVQV